jgi:uroporphyrinogen III methyltransferase/synthase
MNPPRVYIVGTGPGDPSLISVRGLRRLQAAEVVVYDHRVPPRVLRLAPSEAERIDVGPAAPKPLDQDAICFLLAEKAREGKTVVRLKWGDPFVFDSGGKEALFLHEQGVPFEVVPGVPVAIGGPAYAGVPITYPGAGDLVTFVRGHEAETDAAPQLDWNRLAGLEGTIVCYAGARQIGMICDALRSHGRSEEEPAALVYAPTTAAQTTIEGTIGTIAARAKNGEPALLVIGRVIRLREHLRWFDDRPLFGRRIVVTRSTEQSGEFLELLEDLGAEAIAAPTVRILPPSDSRSLEKACTEAGSYDWIVFTSANAVDYFMKCLVAVSDVRELKGVRICTIGPSTSSRLARYGIRVDLTPSESRTEALIDSIKAHAPVENARVLLPRSDIARELLADELRAAGADVVEVVAYRTALAIGDREGDHDVYRMLLDGQIDAVTFTSASTVRNFVEILGHDQAVDLLRNIVVASIGPVTAEAAQQLNISTTVIPERYTIPDLVQALVEHFTGHPTAGALR